MTTLEPTADALSPVVQSEVGGTKRGTDQPILIGPADSRVRIYVWQTPVRLTHWVTVASIMVLTVTGGYIGSPFLIPQDATTMGTMRNLHMLSAFVFLCSGLVRTYWLFAGNRFARWQAFIPTHRAQAQEMANQTAWYVFLRPNPPRVLGHNSLAAGTYLVVFALLLLQTITGFTLAGVSGREPWAGLFGWVPGIIAIQDVRLIHHFLMWAILAFMIHHVYSALLVDHWERNGLMSSIFSGFKFATRREIEEARDGGVDIQEVDE
jgi:Ni/Fe-hydrogenase 1 B-type cytochrome subunit